MAVKVLAVEQESRSHSPDKQASELNQKWTELSDQVVFQGGKHSGWHECIEPLTRDDLQVKVRMLWKSVEDGKKESSDLTFAAGRRCGMEPCFSYC